MIDFDKILKQCLAKSDRTTLYNHIEDLNKQFDIFVKNYPDVLSSEEQKILKIAIKYHDYGKLNDLFQKKLKKQVVSDIIPHQFLSPLFLRKDENYKNFEFSDLCILTYAILNHHARGIDKYLKNGYHGVNTLLSDIKSNVEKFFGYLGIQEISDKTEELYKKILECIVRGELLNSDKFVRLIKVTGILIRIDHSASGDDLVVEEEPIKEDRTNIFLNYLKKSNKEPKLRPFQEKFKDKENLVLVADTGLGKTGLSFLWSKRKIFYVLPNRTSTNAMYETLSNIVGKDKVGLLHSTSLYYVYETSKNDKEDIYILRDYENTKNLSKPITVCTADQLFTAVYKYPTYEKIYATLSYSDIVIDEIQGFEPRQIVPMIKQIEETIKLGARYLIITATLPSIVKKELENLGFTIIDNDEDSIDKVKRHKVELLESDIFSLKDKILEEAQKGKSVLCIVNIVSTAQDLYLKLKDNNKGVKVNLLHSRFILKDRREKEFNILNKKGGEVWITTQLVEASLDVDFDVLFTEVATADSLIQRMGRVWRHKTEDYVGGSNIYIAKKVDEKKTANVYEKALIDETIRLIKCHLDKEGYLNSLSKRKIVEKLYDEENLRKIDSKYLKRWEDAKKLIDSGWDYLFKSQAQEVFRDTFTIECIPYIYREKVKELLADYHKTKNNPPQQKRLERVKILQEINNLKVPIPVYWVINEKIKNNSPIEELDSDLGIYVLNKYFEYNNEIGITISEELLKNYQTEDIFL